jgi:catechol 2,3-dioxygenase-like lactoylglutathione lyase family enzyme
MGIERLDHVNIRTTRLPEMIAWYEKFLGLKSGPRPGFSFPGAWMYAGPYALVHLVGVDVEPGSDPNDLKLEHGAFRATGFKEMVALLEAEGQRLEIVVVPDFPVVQINVWDPDGNHLHIDYHSDEMA